MNTEEWMVTRVDRWGLVYQRAQAWDEWLENYPGNAQLKDAQVIARGLTREQAEQMCKLANEDDE